MPPDPAAISVEVTGVITIIDYKAGNLTSVQLAFEALGVAAQVTDQPDLILAAEKIVFPGVGAARASMESLAQLNLIEPIRQVIQRGTPFLGICIGMQLLFDSSEENDNTPCLGVVQGTVRRFRPADPLCKIPQMGWNTVEQRRPHPLLNGIEDESEFYFVHSYYPSPVDDGVVAGQTKYADVRFSSIIARDNLFATQFHPEKSGRIGLRLFNNFCEWNGQC